MAENNSIRHVVQSMLNTSDDDVLSKDAKDTAEEVL